jgi:ribulose-phosphate 3-epimerase
MIELAPSILSADFARLVHKHWLPGRAEEPFFTWTSWMSHFVPNITIGPPVVASLRKISRVRSIVIS